MIAFAACDQDVLFSLLNRKVPNKYRYSYIRNISRLTILHWLLSGKIDLTSAQVRKDHNAVNRFCCNQEKNSLDPLTL